MNNPKEHIKQVPEDRKAIAPYNFVELPDRVVEAQEIPSNNEYHLNFNTGKIECTLTTSSPLYTRCAMSPKNFQEYSKSTQDMKEDEKKEWEENRKDILAPFFSYSADGLPVIPGSSLRGMLRTLVEIISFSKIDRVSGQKRLFFRAVASNPKYESWGQEYKKYVHPNNIEAGYLKKDGQGWYIHPAKTMEITIKKNDEKINIIKTFAWVKENFLKLPKFKKFNNESYEPQYVDVSYDNVYVDNKDRAKRLFARNVDTPGKYPTNKGVLVTSGNMKQTANESSPRRNHCLVFEKDSTSTNKYRIEKEVIQDYLNALTDFQKESPFTKEDGMLKEDRPAFYLPPKSGSNSVVAFFGHSPNFRIPYSPQGDGRATTVVDFIPEDLRKLTSIDIADAIFGWVKQESEDEKFSKDFQKERAGRVFVTDASFKKAQNSIWYEEEPLKPKILSEPKPSYFPHYLVQKSAEPTELKHYANKGKTFIRGHKLYWHKGSNPNFKHPTPEDEKIQSQITKIKPINNEVTFKFDIHFENLTGVELGALMWVLDIAKDDAYRLKLGMGKPLGMGAVKIEHELCLSRRDERYKKLFDGDNWHTAEIPKVATDYIGCFQKYMQLKLGKEKEESFDFRKLERIRMLLEMLSWPGHQNTEAATRYMEIERKREDGYILNAQPEEGKVLGDKVNEYTKRPVLPTPLDDIEVKLETARSLPPKTNSQKSSKSKPNLPNNSPQRPEKKTSNSSESKFSEGQIVEAEVINVEEKEIKKSNGKIKKRKIITYKIKGSDCTSTEEVNENKANLTKGETVQVRIEKVSGGSVKRVKHLE